MKTVSPVTVGPEGGTRAAILTLLLEDGPITATDIGARLQLSAVGVRRHLDALVTAGDVEVTQRAGAHTGRGRPAKWFQLSPTGRGRLRHAYDDLAGAAMRRLRRVGGDSAVQEFARDRVTEIVQSVRGESPEERAQEIADALTSAGFAASTQRVGTGVQICQHHCPVAHVAAEFPELCAAETEVFSDLLGTHVQRLATIANGDCVCTTHVPLVLTPLDEHERESVPAPTSPTTTKEIR